MKQSVKVFKKAIVLVTCVLLMLSTVGVVHTLAATTEKQHVVHEIAELARSIGLGEDDPIIVRAKEIWSMEEQSNVKQNYNIVINETDVIVLAKMAWGEARGCSDMEVAATMWCVLNRVDNWGGTVSSVVTSPNQFSGYADWCPVEERFYNLAVDVLISWQKEKQGAPPEEVGRVLPKDYMYFSGDGRHNYFRNSYSNGTVWDWSLPNPYN